MIIFFHKLSSEGKILKRIRIKYLFVFIQNITFDSHRHYRTLSTALPTPLVHFKPPQMT